MSVKVITGKDTRLSYMHVWEPKSFNGGKAKYSLVAISPKTDQETHDKIVAAIEEAYKEGESVLKGNGKTVPPLDTIRTPLRDGDGERPDDPAYADSWFINASSVSPPEIVDAGCNPITDRSEIYSGIYGRVSLTFYAYNTAGNRGIACGLNNIQKIRDGEPLSAKASAAEDFAGLDDDDEGFLD